MKEIQVLYTAAHAGFRGQAVPLGGGAAVANQLITEWERTLPFALRVLDPTILGRRAPGARDLVEFNERAYARFCREFEQACTAEVLRHDPQRTVVLSNDVSEGPEFRTLAAQGYRVFTIYHVDVVAYVADIYLRGRIRPQTLVRLHERIGRWVSPDILKLIFDKQRGSVEGSRALLVPSAGMKDVLERCYGTAAAGKVQVVPWGTWAEDGDPVTLRTAAERLRLEFSIPEDAICLLTVSRISPEKGQHLLLEAIRDWKPERPVWLFVCGEAAFMQGKRYESYLRRLATSVKHVEVRFPGYVTGQRKQGFFALADVFVFPSEHESYGLTLLEALHAGLPAVCLDHHGAREVMREEFGAIVRPAGLRPALEKLVADPAARKRCGEAARRYALTQRFSNAAKRIAELIVAER